MLRNVSWSSGWSPAQPPSPQRVPPPSDLICGPPHRFRDGHPYPEGLGRPSVEPMPSPLGNNDCPQLTSQTEVLFGNKPWGVGQGLPQNPQTGDSSLLSGPVTASPWTERLTSCLCLPGDLMGTYWKETQAYLQTYAHPQRTHTLLQTGLSTSLLRKSHISWFQWSAQLTQDHCGGSIYSLMQSWVSPLCSFLMFPRFCRGGL